MQLVEQKIMAVFREKSKDNSDEFSTDFSNDPDLTASKNDRMSTIDMEDERSRRIAEKERERNSQQKQQQHTRRRGRPPATSSLVVRHREDTSDMSRLNEMTASYSEISFDSQPSPADASILDDHMFLGNTASADLDAMARSEKRKIDKDRSQSFEEFPHESDSKRPDTLDLQKCKNEADSSDSDNLKYPKALGDLHLEGTVTQEGDMVLFVAEDLETKIKLASPVTKKGDTPPFPGSRSSTPSLYRQALMPQLPTIDPNMLNDIEIEARRVATSVDTLTENLAGILHSVSALTVECLETYRDAVCKTCDAVDSNIKSMYQLMAKCEELSKSMKPIYKLSEQIKEIKRLLDLFENVVNS